MSVKNIILIVLMGIAISLMIALFIVNFKLVNGILLIILSVDLLAGFIVYKFKK